MKLQLVERIIRRMAFKVLMYGNVRISNKLLNVADEIKKEIKNEISL